LSGDWRRDSGENQVVHTFRFSPFSLLLRRQTQTSKGYYYNYYYTVGIIMMVREKKEKKDSTRSDEKGKLVFPVPLFTISQPTKTTTTSNISSLLLFGLCGGLVASIIIIKCVKALYCFLSRTLLFWGVLPLLYSSVYSSDIGGSSCGSTTLRQEWASSRKMGSCIASLIAWLGESLFTSDVNKVLRWGLAKHSFNSSLLAVRCNKCFY